MSAEKDNKKSKRAGLSGTLFFHGALLLILIIIKLNSPPLPDEDEGIMISFGNSDQGMGEVQPTQISNADSPKESDAKELKEPDVSDPTPVKPQPVQTQDVEEAPKLPKTNRNPNLLLRQSQLRNQLNNLKK